MLAKKFVLSILLTALTGGTGVAVAAEQGHHHEHPTTASPTLDHGKKWQTDAALRKGMEGIRQEISAVLPKAHKNGLSPEQYAATANKINGHVDYIVKNCKLPAQADAQLHIVIGNIMQGTEAMKTGGGGKDGALQIVRALDSYGSHFEHDGWTKVARK